MIAFGCKIFGLGDSSCLTPMTFVAQTFEARCLTSRLLMSKTFNAKTFDYRDI